MGETRVAEADRDKAVQVAEAQKQRNIGIRERQREQAVRVAELDKEQQVGEQSAGFERESQVKESERQMRVRVADANATAIEGENTAKAAVAEAEKIEQERRAALEAPAKAQKAQTIVDAKAEAEKRRIEAQGEASAIFAKLEAETKGQYEILAKKGDGLQRIVEACGGSQEAFQMLMLEHLDSLAERSAEAISNIKFDKVIVWENGLQDGKSNTASFLHSMARTLPPMLQVMRDIGGVEMPEYLAKLSGEDGVEGGGQPAAPKAAPQKPANPPQAQRKPDA